MGQPVNLPCGKIDIHTHLTQAGAEAFLSGRRAGNDRPGVERSVILPSAPLLRVTRQPFTAPMAGNSGALAVCREDPEHFSWFCNVCPDGTPETFRRLQRFKAQGACGVGEFASQLRFDDPLLDHLLACCEALKLPFLFHLSPGENWGYGAVDRQGLPLLERALQKYPGLVFIGHSKAFWFELSCYPGEASEAVRNSCPNTPVEEGRLLELFGRYGNLYGDLSAGGGANAVMRDPDFGIRFMERFQDRLMFGTDEVMGEGRRPEGEKRLERERWPEEGKRPEEERRPESERWPEEGKRLGEERRPEEEQWPEEGRRPEGPLSPWLDNLFLSGQISATVYRKICRDNAVRLFL